MIERNMVEKLPLSEPSIEDVEHAIIKLLTALGLDWTNDPNMSDTPRRVANMLVHELFAGLYNDEPKFTAFPNDHKYDQLVISDRIQFYSTCSHHLMPFFGTVAIGILPNAEGKLPGYSKYSRIVEHYARMPQLQENLTEQIAAKIQKVCQPDGVAVRIQAKHMCACARGVNQQEGRMTTLSLHGKLRTEQSIKQEFLSTCSS